MVYIFKYNPSGEPLGPSAPLANGVFLEFSWASVSKNMMIAILPCMYDLIFFSFIILVKL